MSGATTNGAIPPWEPDELGVPQAGIASIVLVTLVVVGIIYAGTHLPKPPQPIIPVTEVHMVELPKPPPPKPLPKPPPPPPPILLPVVKPVPLPIIAHPVPVPTKIPVPVKHMVIHHKPPPPKRVIIRHTPPQVKPQPRPQPQPAFNAAAYGSAVRGPIERGIHVTPAMNMLRLQGTAYIEFELMPNGHLMFAKIYRSSGNPLIDKAALAGVERNRFPPFPGTAPRVWAVPIFIGPDGSDQ